MRSLIPPWFFSPCSTQYHIYPAEGDLIHCNYFIDSFSGLYHCSFPSIKHMPGWIMRSHTERFLLRQKPPWCMFVSCSQSSLSFKALDLPLPLYDPLLHSSSSSSFYVCRHTSPAGLQNWAQEPDCAHGSHSCPEVWGAAGLGDSAVGERRPPPGTSAESARLSALQHDWEPQER